jgi:preprotein translocase subunit SecE
MSILDRAAKAAGDKQRTTKKKGRMKAFFRGVWSELKKVHWPSAKQLVSYTGVVILTVLAMSAAISLFDWIFSSLIKLLLNIS